MGLSIMTQCVPGERVATNENVDFRLSPLFLICVVDFAVALFTLAGFAQMTIWARGKHKTYIREFKDYPNLRMPILPLIL